MTLLAAALSVVRHGVTPRSASSLVLPELQRPGVDPGLGRELLRAQPALAPALNPLLPFVAIRSSASHVDGQMYSRLDTSSATGETERLRISRRCSSRLRRRRLLTPRQLRHRQLQSATRFDERTREFSEALTSLILSYLRDLSTKARDYASCAAAGANQVTVDDVIALQWYVKHFQIPIVPNRTQYFNGRISAKCYCSVDPLT